MSQAQRAPALVKDRAPQAARVRRAGPEPDGAGPLSLRSRRRAQAFRMASENSPRGRAQIALVVAGVVAAMLLAAGAIHLVAGAHGLQVPGSSTRHSGH